MEDPGVAGRRKRRMPREAAGGGGAGCRGIYPSRVRISGRQEQPRHGGSATAPRSGGCMLFSATLPSALADFAKAGLHDPHIVRLDLDKKISPDLRLAFFTLRQEEKLAALLYLVRERISSEEQTIFFVSIKHHVEFLSILFREEGLEPSLSYGAMDQEARMIHISKFRARKTILLIVTDVAARGLDIPLLDNVVNWDFPAKPKLFVYRVGRVARQGRSGIAYTFVTSEDMPYLLDLHLFLSRPLRPAPTEEELLKDMDNINMKIDQAIANGESVYGRFPQTVLDLASDGPKEVISGCTELTALEKPCANAFQLRLVLCLQKNLSKG